MPPRKDNASSRKRSRPQLPPSRNVSASISLSAPIPASASSSPTPNLGSSSPSFQTVNGVALDMKPRRRNWNAPIWNHYETHNGEEYEDGLHRAFCKYCGGGPIMAESEKGTSNFKRHFEACSARDSEIELVLGSNGQMMYKVDQTFYKEMVCLAIIRQGYTFTHSEHEGTRVVHKFLNETCKPFSRHIAKNYVMKIHKREMEKLREAMSNISGRICLTSDMWTSCVDQGFMSLTAHFVDDDYILQSKIQV